MIKMNYELNPPRYFVGQTVNFLHHNKNMLVGKIVSVETHYSTIRDTVNPHGYHIYAITTPTAKKRNVWIGEHHIDGVVSNDL